MTEHECPQRDRIYRLEQDVRDVEREMDRKVAAVYAKYNGKIDNVEKRMSELKDQINKGMGALKANISDLDKKLSLSALKISMIIAVGSFVASLVIQIADKLIEKAL